MRVLFLINNAFGIGGTIKTTFTLGTALAARGHDVQVLSTVRSRDVPQLPLDPSVRLLSLVETRTTHPDHENDAPGRGEPAALYPRSDFKASTYDRFTEERYRQFLRRSDADVVIATRPGLITYAARFTRRSVVRIGQEHLIRGQHRKALRELMPRYIRELDAFVTVSARDAEEYREHLRLRRTRLLHIPNGIHAPGISPSHGRARLVVAAGRLVGSKRYDVLIRAFAKVVAERPDWQLRIYGVGDQDRALRALVLELGLHNHVRMMGGYTPIEPEWAKASIAAVSADREPFGMTLVEAMRCGVPVVSTDAPHGPGEILRHGEDGLLTPVGDPDAMGDALLRVINDDGLRRGMARAALANSARYDPAPIAQRYEELITELAAGKRRAFRWPWQRPETPLPVLGPVTETREPAVDWDGVAPLPGDLTWQPAGAGVSRLVRADGTGVQAGLRDTRALMDSPVGTRVRLPFRDSDGVLAVREWDRPAYAEMAGVEVDADGVHVDGRIFGVAFSEAAAAEARQGDRRAALPIAVDGVAFRVSVGALDAGTWELWICPAMGREPVRLGRVRDDIVDKRTAFVLPSARVGGVALQPVFDQANDLSIRATP